MRNEDIIDNHDIGGSFLANDDDPVMSHYLAYLAEDIQNNPSCLHSMNSALISDSELCQMGQV